MYRHVQTHPHQHSNSNQHKDSKYFIHIDDQHTQSEIDLDLIISVRNPTNPFSPPQPSKNFNNSTIKQKPFITTESKKHQNPQINNSKLTNKKYIKYKGHPDPVLQYTENERDYGYRPVETEKYLKQRSSKKKKRVSVKVQKVKTQDQQLFEFYKKRCTEGLKSKSKIKSLNKTFQTNRSLSPQCEQITQKLHHSRINNQPCTKMINNRTMTKKKKMALALQNYTFLKRYLTEKQIQCCLQQFENEGLPEYKWPMRIVQIANEKLSHMRRY